MNGLSEDVVARLGSADVWVRLSSWGGLYGECREDLYRFFLSRVKDHYVADDLTQDMYLKLRTRLTNNPLTGENIKSYLFDVADSLFREWWGDKNEFDLETALMSTLETPYELQATETKSPLEARLVEEFDSQRVIDAYLRLPDPMDRMLMCLTEAGGFSANQISCLIPLAVSTIYHRRRKLTKFFQQYFENTDVLQQGRLSKEDQFWLTDDLGYPGITLLNHFPTNLAEEVKRQLYTNFGVSTLDELLEVTIPLLVVHNVKSMEIEPRLCFMLREEVGLKMFMGTTVNCFDFIPRFEEKKVDGKRRPVVCFEKDRTYSAKVVGEFADTQYDLHGVQWLYSLPECSVTVRKVLDPRKLPFYNDPDTQKVGVFVFRASPNDGFTQS